MFVGEFIPHSARAPQEPTHFTNVYVKNFPNDWDEAKLKDKFAEYGIITSCMLSEDKKGRKFAFVNYEDADMAKAV